MERAKQRQAHGHFVCERLDAHRIHSLVKLSGICDTSVADTIHFQLWTDEMKACMFHIIPEFSDN